MDRYPPIAEHGLIGDLQTAALVSSQGVVDWFAAPRFDSPSVFAALLDHDRGGYFRLSPENPETTATQLYYPDSAVLVTRFTSADGIGEVVDWMPPDRKAIVASRHTMYRVARVVRGTVRFSLECRPRFDYGRAKHELDLDSAMATFRAPGTTAYVQAEACTLERDGDDVRGEFTLHTGEFAAVVFTFDGSDAPPPAPLDVDGITEQLWGDIGFWQKWVRTSDYRGRWPGLVARSAITIKLLTYAPTAAPTAAATMALPEQIGGERNWDYRYTWVRDGSLSVRAMLDLGFVEEATGFVHWLKDRLHDREGTKGEPLQIMYRVDGEPLVSEEILEHFEGYRGSAPVRVGNAAADQLQLDIYGEAMYAFSEGREMWPSMGYDGWKRVAKTLDWLVDSWDRPDEGIWETRGGRKDFTYSRVMCWVAFDRGIRMAMDLGRPADLGRWTAARDAILEQVMQEGWSQKEGGFVQHYGGEGVLDASLLLIPRVGFLAPRDPAWLSTLDAMDRKLVSDSLVYRYDPAASPDGLRGSEGTFSLCTFLYIDALARAGRLRQASYAFEKMHAYCNHLGLFSEEIGPTGEQLGNFPQAFTHLSLIMAAKTLDRVLDAAAEPGRL